MNFPAACSGASMMAHLRGPLVVSTEEFVTLPQAYRDKLVKEATATSHEGGKKFDGLRTILHPKCYELYMRYNRDTGPNPSFHDDLKLLTQISISPALGRHEHYIDSANSADKKVPKLEYPERSGNRTNEVSLAASQTNVQLKTLPRGTKSASPRRKARSSRESLSACETIASGDNPNPTKIKKACEGCRRRKRGCDGGGRKQCSRRMHVQYAKRESRKT
ncbi:hypothetical protein CERSUDRAFT_126004 [Gelatoporia subvermispora B]|uniref:Uncharacterized protein n=1 Tax=Ceriporiopsis subvermispora (strain B) TaxID=914234 RepID=M2QA23_CERS8|nr:hypothetical protein CERSUDRAFT_126004 [Gelatoporia subvermispora B]